ncbi:MAG: ATP-grasp domain-containing protein, partial [Actinomycetota bacterium]|nr:ATP-grasp domain-containing protein [Actinomycetota bacterium]
RLAARVVVAPSAEAVAAAQDRIAEKAFLAGHGFAVAPYTVVAGAGDVDAAVSWMVGPCLLKTARLGYDGKGQAPIGTATELRQAWDALGGEPAVLERRVPLDHELSVVVARAADGRTATYPVVENHHVGGILDLSVVPARVEPAVARRAEEVGVAVADELAYVGVLAVELFVSDGDVLVNELAPRPHNSGHWTLDAAVTSQFQQQVRAVCGQALGSTTMTTPAAAMVNLLGDSWSGGEPDWSSILADPAARLHLYGKTTARPARKMGHVTVLADDADAAVARALDLRTRLSRSA